MIITIDGPSGTGKSTLAKAIASRLNIKYLNSGMIYRAFTYYFLKNNILPENEDKINEELNKINVKIEFINNGQHIFIEGEDCLPYVNDIKVSDNVSLYSQILNLRNKVLHLQRDFASKNNIVIEGRDIGTEVFPNANYKFYVDCDIIVRAKRRYEDLINAGKSVSLEEVIKSLENRDYLDKTRKYSPLVKPANAIEINTANKTIEETVNEMFSFIS